MLISLFSSKILWMGQTYGDCVKINALNSQMMAVVGGNIGIALNLSKMLVLGDTKCLFCF